MSHLVVLVIGADIEKQLAPFDENLREVFKDTTERLLKKYNEDSTSAIPIADGKWHYASKDEGGADIRFNEMYPTFEAFCKDWEEEEPNAEGHYGYMHNPQAKWDWYQVGGRWTGYFKAKPGTTGKLGEKSWGVDAPEAGWFDAIRKGDIDFEAMMMEERIKANERYDLYETTVAGLEVPKRWAEFREEFADIAVARTAYHAQPYIAALATAKLNSWSEDAVDVYGGGRDLYVKRACYSTFVPYAVLKDGEWAAHGEMGWFGMSTETVDQDAWQERITEIIFALPDDTIITAVDCHI